MGPKQNWLYNQVTVNRATCSLFALVNLEPVNHKLLNWQLKDQYESSQNLQTLLFFDDFKQKGLFQHLVAHEGMALIAHSQMSSFYELILKRQQEGSGEQQFFCCL